MVATGFFQRTVPLIRYRIGDIGVLAEKQTCPCGRQMPIVKYIGGRESDVLFSTERGLLGSTAASWIHSQIPWTVKASQIEQVGIDLFVFRYVPTNKPLSEQEESHVVYTFQQRLGKSIDVKIEVVNEIPKDPNGKSRFIIGLSDKNNSRNKK